MTQPMTILAGSLLSPVIVGRDDLVALAKRRLDEVGDRHGHLLLVSGEAGIGKTRFIGAVEQLAGQRGFRIARAEVAPQDRDVMAASFLDLGRAMRRDPRFEPVGRGLLDILASRLNAPTPRRRDMVSEVVDLLVTEVPTLLVFEDLQWADDLSLETLTELARATRDRPTLIIGAYRTNVALNASGLREWRSRLVTQRIAEDVRLARLTREETALMTTLILGTGLPAPSEVVDAVYARSDGVPLHIEELCSAIGRERLADSRAVLDADVPNTLEDATLARIARLSKEAQAVARAGAVVGRSFAPGVLAGIMNLPVEALDDPIQELVEHDILDPAHRTGHYDFRHQLLRDALYRTVPAGDRRRFHARAAEFGGQLEGATEIHASMHYERAGMTDEAYRTALDAARQAMKLSSHREAFDLLHRAIDNMPASLPDGEKASVLLLFSDACGNVDRTGLMAEFATRARELAVRAGETFVAIEALNNLNVVARRDGQPIASRRDLARRLLNEIEAAPDEPRRDLWLIVALYVLGVVEMDAGGLRESRALFLEGRELSVRTDNVGLVQVMDQYLAQLDIVEGRVADGLATIRSLGEAFNATGQEDSRVSSYRDVALFAMRAMDFRAAGIGVAEGLRFAESVEQTFCGHYLEAAESLVAWAAGDWDDAIRLGGQAIVERGEGHAHAIAQWALGYVGASRGRRGEAEEQLLPAAAFGRHADRLDLLLPAQWGLAEAALHAGDPERAAELCEEALGLARAQGECTLIAPFAVTGVRAHQASGRPDDAARFLERFLRAIGPGADIARPSILHATGLVRLSQGSITAARDAFTDAIEAWEARGRRWEALWARLDLASVHLRSNRYADATSLIREVREVAEALESEPLLARAAQLAAVARGRGEDLDPWHPLTTREFEVARKIAEGLTNAEIGEQLFVSSKTVSAHVEHILAKLGVSRRAEIAAWTSTIGSASAAGPGETISSR